jgi:hypothetical protein
MAQYRKYFGDDLHPSIPFFPLADYLVRLAVAGAIAHSPERVHAGMHDISRGHASAFADSILGQVLIRFLARDPVRLIEQGIAMRRQMATFGRWSIVRFPGERRLEVVHEEEYVWLESAIVGSAVGTFEARGLEATVDYEPEDRFNGRTILRWGR